MNILKAILALAPGLLLAFGLVACEGGSDNSAPVAEAGPDQVVSTSTVVTLDGSGSSDADGDTLTYSWSFANVPEGSSLTSDNIDGATTVNPTFIPDADGSYVVRLTVNDGTVDSAADFVSLMSYGPAKGVLDTAYGTSGAAAWDSGLDDYGFAVTLQPDGKSLVTGLIDDGRTKDLLLMRFNIDGTPDNTFGTDGVALYEAGSSSGRAVALQSDGKILVAGSYKRINHDLLLLRFNADGTLDGTFGTNGVARYDSGLHDFGLAVAPLADGRFLAAGYNYNGTDNDILLLQFNPDGTLDTSYGTSGVASWVSGLNEHVFGLAVQAGGKALVTGYNYSTDSTDKDIMLARFNADGTLDTAFGASGTVFWNGVSYEDGTAIALQPDGKALVAGHSWNGTDWDIVLLRYNQDGTTDTTFGTDGVASWGSTSEDKAYGLALQADGKALVAGYNCNGATCDIVLVRFNADGTLDTSFGTDGVALSGGGGLGYSVALQADGKALLTGRRNIGADWDIVLVRFE